MNPYGQGYPQQGGGYPGQGYPQQNVSMPEPYGGAGGQAPYPQGGGGLPYAAQPPQIGFSAGGPPSSGYPAQPPQQGFNPPQPGYPQAGGYGAPPSGGYGAPPSGGYGGPPSGGYGGPPSGGYGGPPSGPPSGGYGGPPSGSYGPPSGGYGAPPQQQGYGGPPAPGAGAMYGQQPSGQSGYGPPPSQVPAQGGYAPPPQQSYAPPSAQPSSSAPPSRPPPAGAVPTAAMAGMSLSAKQPKTEGTVKAQQGFSAERDCEVLRKAMKGFGTDEKAIIDVLANRSNAQRQELKTLFKTMYGKDLIKDLKSELGGKFEDVVVAVMDKPDEYDAKECRKAIEGLGTDEDTLIEILCTRSNKQIHEIKAAYKKLFKRDLEKDLSGDLSGYFRRLMISLCAAGRQEDLPIDQEKAKRHAQELYAAGAKKLGTDESKFNMILCSQSYAQLQLTFDEYQKMTGKTMEQVIASEMSGDLESGMKAVVKCVRNRQAYFAEKLYKSMKGAGTKDRALIRIMVSRCEVDMVQIKQEFQRAYGKPLANFIQDDTSGDYKRMLLALCK